MDILNSKVLKVAHHGSKTSTCQSFIEAVKPKIALIGIGENNKFGHPNDIVIERLEKIGSKIYRTDQMGEIMLSIDCDMYFSPLKEGKTIEIKFIFILLIQIKA